MKYQIGQLIRIKDGGLNGFSSEKWFPIIGRSYGEYVVLIDSKDTLTYCIIVESIIKSWNIDKKYLGEKCCYYSIREHDIIEVKKEKCNICYKGI